MIPLEKARIIEYPMAIPIAAKKLKLMKCLKILVIMVIAIKYLKMKIKTIT